MSKQWDWGNDWGNDVVIGCMFQCWLVGEILCGNSENNIDKFRPPKFIRCTFHLWRMNPWWNLVLFAVFWFIGRSPSDLPKKMDTPPGASSFPRSKADAVRGLVDQRCGDWSGVWGAKVGRYISNEFGFTSQSLIGTCLVSTEEPSLKTVLWKIVVVLIHK